MNLICLIELSQKPFTDEYTILKEKSEQFLASDFSFDTLKKRSSLIGRLAVALFTKQKLSADNSELVFCYKENGKPYLKAFPNFFFNISHSEMLVAIGFSDTEIGIDTEKLRLPNFKIAERFFSADEKIYIGDNPKHFFEVWTKKEAFLKREGTGLKFPLSSYDVIKNKNTFNTLTFGYKDYLISFANKSKEFNLKTFTELEFLKTCISEL